MPSTSNDLQTELSSWCASYVEAFSAYDAAGIEDHWTFPAFIIHDGGRTTFKTPGQFSANTSALLSFYKRRGVARAERKLISCMSLSTDVASMQVHDVMLNADAQNIVEWHAGYMLQRSGGTWKAVCAVATGETAAWRAIGTPLGS